MDPVPTSLYILLELLADSEHGYRQLSDGLKRDAAVLLCLEESMVRAEYHEQLKHAMRRAWKDVPEGGTMAGWAHRGWLELQITMSLPDHMLLGSAVTCEAAMIAGYEEALKEVGQVRPGLRPMLEHQARHVQTVHASLKVMSGR